MGRDGNSSPAKGYSYFVVYVTENVLGESYELPVESIQDSREPDSNQSIEVNPRPNQQALFHLNNGLFHFKFQVLPEIPRNSTMCAGCRQAQATEETIPTTKISNTYYKQYFFFCITVPAEVFY